MKKLKTNNRLAFNKAAVTELNDSNLALINGGTNPYFQIPNLGCFLCVNSSKGTYMDEN